MDRNVLNRDYFVDKFVSAHCEELFAFCLDFKKFVFNVIKEIRTIPLQVIMATNRSDTLDPALLRPGRLDRKIEFPMPDRRQKRLIFSTITGKMNLSEEVDLEDYVARPDKISGADINAICQEVTFCLCY